MNLKNYIVIVLLGVMLLSCSKVPTIGTDQKSSFVKLFGGSALDVGTGVVECSDGGYAITGTMQTSRNKSQAFLIRTDKYGNELSWSPKFIGGSATTSGSSIILTSDNNYLITGAAISNAGDTDLMVTKISDTGNTVWYKTYGGTSDDAGKCAIELNGSYFIGGYTKSYTFGGKDDWLLNLSKDGSLVWQKNYGGTQDDYCSQILPFENNLLLVGTTYSYQTTDTIPNLFLVELDPTNYLTPLGGQNYGGLVKTSAVQGIVTGSNQFIIFNDIQTRDSSQLYAISFKDDIYTRNWEKSYHFSANVWAQSVIQHGNQIIVMGSEITSVNQNFSTQTFDTNGNLQSESFYSSLGDQSITSGLISKDDRLVYTGRDIVNGVSKVVLAKVNLQP